ncbi:hypothetical protein HYV85_03525 [Candidatus Woesearchaeota archaeon]|nr:hypothetical protein [Candidatus Woesearchaeota archaeon]
MFEDYDTEFGYSFSDLRRDYSRKAYAVPDYDAHSLEEIELSLATSKYAERGECLEHSKFLEDLQKRLSMIALAEEREGIMNWELREVLEKVRRLTRQLAAVMEKLPEVVVYKTPKKE